MRVQVMALEAFLGSPAEASSFAADDFNIPYAYSPLSPSAGTLGTSGGASGAGPSPSPATPGSMTTVDLAARSPPQTARANINFDSPG